MAVPGKKAGRMGEKIGKRDEMAKIMRIFALQSKDNKHATDMKKRITKLIWKKAAGAALLAAMATGAGAQDTEQGTEAQGFVHGQSEEEAYVWPTDPAVREKLDRWQDLKFGVLFHWGLYSVAGIVESWSICSEDEDWISRRKDMTYDEYKRWYWGLADSLRPTAFDPGQWAGVAKEAGMRYMIFTTKHHDGFCMFDSRLTDFTIARGPFGGDPRRDAAWHVLDAFRQEGFMVGCYFSKPDWHCEWYWNPYFATPDRRENYRRERHPEWWRRYAEFTRGQLEELTSRYGRIDILWLDGGWVSGGEIGLDGVLAGARERHPGLLAVDRTIGGKNENYQTPERSVPEEQLPHPWESCIPLSNDWGWTPAAPYKSARTVIGLLAEVTAKGGCLLLGVGPTPEGIIEEAAAERLREVGRWLRANGEAIYGTRTTKRYRDGDTWFTASKDGRTLYAIRALRDGESLPGTIEWKGNVPTGKMTLVDGGRKVKYTVEDGKVRVTLPEDVADAPVALRFTIKEAEK